jgi:hypothetical protein
VGSISTSANKDEKILIFEPTAKPEEPTFFNLQGLAPVQLSASQIGVPGIAIPEFSPNSEDESAHLNQRAAQTAPPRCAVVALVTSSCPW